MKLILDIPEVVLSQSFFPDILLHDHRYSSALDYIRVQLNNKKTRKSTRTRRVKFTYKRLADYMNCSEQRFYNSNKKDRHTNRDTIYVIALLYGLSAPEVVQAFFINDDYEPLTQRDVLIFNQINRRAQSGICIEACITTNEMLRAGGFEELPSVYEL